ncbi:cation:proton antiporter [Jannaschia rubra]|uniref:Potassium/proton antiporter n=1 Tax=Jannaschia rubra TaxID=282197 RepID=A0A0M6XST5_9RHOB|nr:cation:proton antiporter [Jannaschia rubra]CTQ33265.1 potassium/proton antiporter [Jannaschia rubra]SFF98088.1 sodium/proton antiporter, CPA1 family [Jannaschia rubra]
MIDDAFFSFSAYHVVLALVGAIVILARWLPRLVSSGEPTAAPLMILFGALAALALPDLPLPADPREVPKIWEIVAEITVIVALFGAGMRVDDIGPARKWIPTMRLLIVAMPLTILAIAFLGVLVGGLTVAGAVILAAVLAPTDPVLAADVQIAPPQEGGEHPVRFALTTEAALNDGLAFPFVYLGLLIAVQGLSFGDWGLQWLLQDVFYRIGVGALTGWAGGWALGQVLFNLPRGSRLADTGSGVIAIAGVFLCYGSTELIEGYGFIAVAVMGLSLRRIESDHGYHRNLHSFSEAIEHALTALLLIALGAALPALMADLDWRHVFMAAILILAVRPIAGWLALGGTTLGRSERGIVAIYGVRGIGSIYYLAYAAGHADLADIADLWTIAALTIFASTVLHGFTVGRAMHRIGQ